MVTAAVFRCRNYPTPRILAQARRLIQNEPEATDRYVAVVVVTTDKLGFCRQPADYSLNSVIISVVAEFRRIELRNASYMPSTEQLTSACKGIDLGDIAERVAFLARVQRGLNVRAERAQALVADILRLPFCCSRSLRLIASLRAASVPLVIAHLTMCTVTLLSLALAGLTAWMCVVFGVAVILPLLMWGVCRIAGNAMTDAYTHFLDGCADRLRPTLEPFVVLSSQFAVEQIGVASLVESRLLPQLRTECEQRLAALILGWKEMVVAGSATSIDVDGAILIARALENSHRWVDLMLLRAHRSLTLDDPEKALRDIEVALEQGEPVVDDGLPNALCAKGLRYSTGIVRGLVIRAAALARKSGKIVEDDAGTALQLASNAIASLGLAEDELHNADLTESEVVEQAKEVQRVRVVVTAAADVANNRITSRVDSDHVATAVTTFSVEASRLEGEQDEMRDFFVSYNHEDRKWAEWIAWQLEDAGHSVIIQAWDFRPGNDFVLEMQKAAVATQKTIAVLTENYLSAEYTQPEWANAFARDPQGNARTLIPVRVARCRPTGLLTTRVYVDLVGLSESEARVALVGVIRDRVKPDTPPPFPGPSGDERGTLPVIDRRQHFPGQKSTALEVWREKVEFLQSQEPIISGSEEKFALRKLIEEAKRKIAELSSGN
jgi:hypothetical protein